MLKLANARLALAALMVAAPLALILSPGEARKVPQPPAAASFDREQFMMINLTRGPNSTGFYLLKSLRHSKEMVKDLDKALRQLQQVERAYTMSRGRPDDRPLASAAEHVQEAHQSAAQLELKLRDAYQDLKTSVQQTLALEGTI